MPLKQPLRLAVLIAVPVVALGVWLLWPSSPPAPSAPPVQTAASPRPTDAPRPSGETAASPSANAASSNPPASPAANATASIDAILVDPSLDNLGAARALAALVRDDSQAEALRSEALRHLLNLSIEHEPELLLPLLKSTKLPDDFAVLILNEALNRPLPWQADANLAVLARSAGKELHAQARDHLAFLTDEQHGDDLKAWTAAVATAKAKWQTDAGR